MPKKRLLAPDETVHASLGIQLLDFDEAEAMANQTWAGAEEILETIDLSRHSASASTLRLLLDQGWESDSVTGLLLGIWMRRSATAAVVATDLLALQPAQRRVLTALYAAGNPRSVVQYSVTRDGRLMEHTYSRKALGSAEIKLFAA